MYAARPGRADLRTMGDATTRGSPIPLQSVSKHIPSANKTPICGMFEGCSGCYSALQSLVLSRACLYPPSEAARLFPCLRPRPSRHQQRWFPLRKVRDRAEHKRSRLARRHSLRVEYLPRAGPPCATTLGTFVPPLGTRGTACVIGPALKLTKLHTGWPVARSSVLTRSLTISFRVGVSGSTRWSPLPSKRNCLIIPERPRRGPPRGLRTGPAAPFGRILSHRMQGLEAALTIYQTVSLSTSVHKGMKGRVPLQKHCDRCGCRASYPQNPSSQISPLQHWWSASQNLPTGLQQIPFVQGSPLHHSSPAAQEPPFWRQVEQMPPPSPPQIPSQH